jgi:8-oxo-dGTP pyrophosphatase MutT (NUDIX family)
MADQNLESRVRASVVVVHDDKILCFFAVDPTDAREFYFLPGGAIEEDETAPETAIRECREETGYEIDVDLESAVDAEYPFHWDGKDYLSFTIFYRGYLVNPEQSPEAVNDASYNKGVRWIPLSEVEACFGYTPEILQAIQKLVAVPVAKMAQLNAAPAKRSHLQSVRRPLK